MCPAIHINSRSWLRSSSTHEPSDPPLRVVRLFHNSIIFELRRYCCTAFLPRARLSWSSMTFKLPVRNQRSFSKPICFFGENTNDDREISLPGSRNNWIDRSVLAVLCLNQPSRPTIGGMRPKPTLHWFATASYDLNFHRIKPSDLVIIPSMIQQDQFLAWRERNATAREGHER